MLLTTIFYYVDNFCKELENRMLSNNKMSYVGRPRVMSSSEIVTIIVYFHYSKAKTFKDYYEIHIKGINRSAFTHIVSYNRFVELAQIYMPYVALTALSCNGAATGVSFIDSTTLSVCNNRRICSHKVLEGLAERGKSSMGWFFGFKLHFVINHYGEILGFTITPGNIDDRDACVIDAITRNLFGKLFGDRGYISAELFRRLLNIGIQLITRLKQNMKNILMPVTDKWLLRKRGVIESVCNTLKNILTLEHTRHRSVTGFFCNIFACITAYAFYQSKPSITNSKKLLNHS